VNYVDAAGNLYIAGKIYLAKFKNNEGLEKVGQNLFRQTANSGSIDVDGDGVELGELNAPGNGGTGTIVAGALEMSNVDLSEEFTEMIVAQRGFQANTRIITTSDQILEELVNLKR
jgi:flagellar hook protein FlgE